MGDALATTRRLLTTWANHQSQSSSSTLTQKIAAYSASAISNGANASISIAVASTSTELKRPAAQKAWATLAADTAVPDLPVAAISVAAIAGQSCALRAMHAHFWKGEFTFWPTR